ncbi:methyltransferase domain-containing protein [Candidatus Kaiserbacteria bacterium]|nr:methyltransferase domain-containing protein [Candidatus Kaiserbacteria bacterium]
MEIPSNGRFVQPDVVSGHFHLREGDRVADFGAGGGFFLSAFSQSVGGSGRVYALDIQRGLVERLGEIAREKGLTNIEPIWCDLEADGGTKLADGVLDAGVLINTLFQIEDKTTALREIARTIRSGGKFIVIDWTQSFAGIGPQSSQVVTESAARDMVEAAGFSFERSFPTGEYHYGLAFRKA